MPSAPRIAVVTTQDVPHPDPEAALLVEALRESGGQADLVAWDMEAADWGGYDLVVVRSPWDYFDRLEAFLSWVDEVATVTRIVNPAGVIRWNSHKGYLAGMAERGVRVLPALVIPAVSADAADQVRRSGWREVVVKPAVDGGARLTLRAQAESPQAGAHAARLATVGDVVLQPYAAEIEAGESSLVFFGGEFSHAVRKVPAPGDYRVQPRHGGTEHPHDPTAAELATADRAMAVAPGRLTYARVDLVDVDGVPTLMELEVIEPDLFFRADPAAVGRFVKAVLAEIDESSGTGLHN
jgi:glutathione synthase/RimK-type ligase-like ATP-grasp enzyme